MDYLSLGETVKSLLLAFNPKTGLSASGIVIRGFLVIRLMVFWMYSPFLKFRLPVPRAAKASDHKPIEA